MTEQEAIAIIDQMRRRFAGNGGYTKGTRTVTPGDVYSLDVGRGGRGAYTGGWPDGGTAAGTGGAGGGGSSRVYISTTYYFGAAGGGGGSNLIASGATSTTDTQGGGSAGATSGTYANGTDGKIKITY